MKVVILAGGFGTRISEESYLKPKPMIEIGTEPILWHIMKEYSHYGFNEFVICLGYKGYVIKDYFANYFLHTSDVTFDMEKNQMLVHKNHSEPWKVTLVDTGLGTMTGGRIKRIQKYVEGKTFMLTYGDGVSDIDINKLLEFHKENKKIATMTAIELGQKYGVLSIDEKNQITSMREKQAKDSSLINGGYMVLEPEIFEFIEGDETVFEQEPLEALVKENQLIAYKHKGFWKCMDTLRDKKEIEEMWKSKNAPWKVWKD